MQNTAYMLFHGGVWKAESTSFEWLKNSAMRFHNSASAQGVFILPRHI